MVNNRETSAMFRMMQFLSAVMMAGIVTGCAHMADVTDEHVMKWKCCHEAKMAWLNCHELYSDVCNPFDFGKGFRAGYQAVCMGSDGCAPSMPPRNYWSHHYQDEEGKCQVMAWFDGYHHGVLAAQCNGCEGRCQVLCAQDLYGGKPCEADYGEIEHKIVPEDEMPLHGPHDGHYPMPIEIHSTPGGPGFADPYGVPMAPESAYDVHTPLIPTPVPGAGQPLNSGIDTSGAPSF